MTSRDGNGAVPAPFTQTREGAYISYLVEKITATVPVGPMLLETSLKERKIKLLFAGGKRLSDLKFGAHTKEGREWEIIERQQKRFSV